MHNCAIAGFLALAFAVIGICGMVPVQAQTQELAFGKHRVTAGFPCTPKEGKQLAGRGERGGEIFLVSLACTHADHTYFLSVMEYPPEVMSANSVDDLLESYRHNTAAKSHVKIKTSQRMTHNGFPAMRYHVLDTRTPEREIIIMSVLVDQSMLNVSLTARAGFLQATKHSSFADSLNIRARK